MKPFKQKIQMLECFIKPDKNPIKSVKPSCNIPAPRADLENSHTNTL